MSVSKKLADLTANIKPDPTRRSLRADTTPKTSPGRMFDAQLRVNESEERREAAEKALAEARDRIKQLESSTVGSTEVAIDTLVEVPGRRRILTPQEYIELRDNLGKNKLMHPIVYRPLGDGRNEIISGHNRVAIYRDDLKRSHIRGVPFDGTDAEVELGAAFSNLLAPALPDWEKYRQFQRMQKDFGFTRKEIIDASGLIPTHIAKILAFDNLPDAAKALIATRPERLGGNAAEQLSALAKAGHGEAVTDAVRALIQDDAMTQEKAIAKAVAASTPKATKPKMAEPVTINIGKRKLCDVQVRSGVVAIRFSGKQGDDQADEWSRRIAEFIRESLEKEQGSE